MVSKTEQFRVIYIEELTKLVEKYPEEYAYPVADVPVVVDRMIPALHRGGANIGPAVKATLKRLGVSATCKGAKDFLNGNGKD